jgi:hypothetical protein
MNSITIDSGIVSGTVPLSTPDPSEQCSGTPATLEKEGEHTVEHQGRRAESPGIAVALEADYVEESVVEVTPIRECSNGTPLAGKMPARQPTVKLQHSDNAEPPANFDGAGTGEHLGEEADETHEDADDVPSPSECSNDEFNRPSPFGNSASEAWLSGNASEDTCEDDIGSLPAKRARRQRKQRSSHCHERALFSTFTAQQSSSRVRKTTRPRRSPPRSSKRIDPSNLTDRSQIFLEPDCTGGKLTPQRLTHMNLRQLESGETFMAAVIQDKRKVAAFAYDQTMVLIKDSIGCGRDIDSLAIMSVSLNSWLLTGFLREDGGYASHSITSSAHFVDAAIDEQSDGGLSNPFAGHTEVNFGLTDVHDVLPAEEDDNSIQDSLQSSSRVNRRSKPGLKRGRWEPLEEEDLKSLAGHETWEEIGKRLNRPPGGVSQHWRKMQLDAAKGSKPHYRRMRNGALRA